MRPASGSAARLVFKSIYRSCARNWRRNVVLLVATTLIYPLPFHAIKAANVSRLATRMQETAFLSETASLQAQGSSNGWINFGDGREVVAPVTGAAELQNEFASSPAAPLVLAAADLDEDGVPDLVSGFRTAEGKGILAVYRGNIDSIYPNTAAARQRRLDGTFTDSPFLSPARLFEVPSAPDFLEMGNFEGDRRQYAVAATRGGNVLYIMDGDGNGG